MENKKTDYKSAGVDIEAGNIAVELIKDKVNGFIFDPNKPQNIKNIIENINNETYLRLVDGVSKCSLNDKDLEQAKSYDIN